MAPLVPGFDLFANVVAHFGINYMAQLMMSFFPLLACISVATFEASRRRFEASEVPVGTRIAPVQPTIALIEAVSDIARLQC